MIRMKCCPMTSVLFMIVKKFTGWPELFSKLFFYVLMFLYEGRYISLELVSVKFFVGHQMYGSCVVFFFIAHQAYIKTFKNH